MVTLCDFMDPGGPTFECEAIDAKGSAAQRLDVTRGLTTLQWSATTQADSVITGTLTMSSTCEPVSDRSIVN